MDAVEVPAGTKNTKIKLESDHAVYISLSEPATNRVVIPASSANASVDSWGPVLVSHSTFGSPGGFLSLFGSLQSRLVLRIRHDSAQTSVVTLTVSHEGMGSESGGSC